MRRPRYTIRLIMVAVAISALIIIGVIRFMEWVSKPIPLPQYQNRGQREWEDMMRRKLIE